MADNDGVVPRSPSKDTTVTDVVLDVANNGTFRERSERKNITHNEIGLLSTVDELTRVQTLGGDEKLLLVLVPERVTEGDSGQWGTSSWVVDDVSDHTFQVTIALAEVERPEPGRTLTVDLPNTVEMMKK
ncbi:hypothetical protein G4B88_018542 [Cannabis sativa]|uniref:Uncharacterized protein n=1 Tax=Cannabis sativa TaxID=3483 RepID=A0A7J6HGG0_CANSA|nr:hypothetical protein G4B88_018542 [Cannabis sativa]